MSSCAKIPWGIDCVCIVSDFHNFVGASTGKFTPHQQPKHILYRSYTHFVGAYYKNYITSAQFHVFDDVKKIILVSFSWTFPKLLTAYHTASLYLNYKHMGGHYQLVKFMASYQILVKYFLQLFFNKYDISINETRDF